jgi:hypothetical protein
MCSDALTVEGVSDKNTAQPPLLSKIMNLLEIESCVVATLIVVLIYILNK